MTSVPVKVYVRVRPIFDKERLATDLALNGSRFEYSTKRGSRVFDIGFVFVYGKTCSGKTYTTLGQGEDELGVFYLALQRIFEHMQAAGASREMVVSLSYFEIYQENIRDLLEPDKTGLDITYNPKAVPPLVISRFEGERDARKRVLLTAVPIASLPEATEHIARGEKHRHYRATRINQHSSRSHAVLRVSLTSRGDDGSLSVRELFIVDLAGSESLAKAHTEKTGVPHWSRETSTINKSLLALERFVSQQRYEHRYQARDSILTRLLGPALGGNALTAIICTVSLSQADVMDTLNTLDFAQRARNIRNRLVKTTVQTGACGAAFVQLREQLAAATEELNALRARITELEQIKNALNEESKRFAAQLSAEERAQLRLRHELADMAADLFMRDAIISVELEDGRQREAHLARQSAVLEKMLFPEREARRAAEEACAAALQQLRAAQSEKVRIADQVAHVESAFLQLTRQLEAGRRREEAQQERIAHLQADYDDARAMLEQQLDRNDRLRARVRLLEMEVNALRRGAAPHVLEAGDQAAAAASVSERAVQAEKELAVQVLAAQTALADTLWMMQSVLALQEDADDADEPDFAGALAQSARLLAAGKPSRLRAPSVVHRPAMAG